MPKEQAKKNFVTKTNNKNFNKPYNYGKKNYAKKEYNKNNKEIKEHKEHKQHVTKIPGLSAFQLRLIQSILHSVLVEKKSLDKAYALWFAKVKLEDIEQGFIIRQINAMFSHLSLYAFISGLKRPSDLSRHINRLIISYCAHKKLAIPELDGGEGFDRRNLDKRIQEAKDDVLLSEGCPIWLNELCQTELKELWPEQRYALALEAPRYIRTNTIKTTREELANKLAQAGVVTKPVKGNHEALQITSNSAIFRTAAFKEGLFEQQDAGSQEIANFLEVAPRMRVIDACAGSGGKTLQLAALMQATGNLIALDVVEWKLDELKKRAKRAGAFNIETRHISSTKVIKRLYDSADRVLIDAPCSGIGVLRRTPDSKWKDIRSSLNELKQIQQDILERYSKMVKINGLIVYSTCSILPSENQEQVRTFLSKHQDSFELIEERNIYPATMFDGFYMAKLKRIK